MPPLTIELALIDYLIWIKQGVCICLFLSARLQAAVVLSPRYPEISPLFSLCLSWKGERSGRTDDNLRVCTFQLWLFMSQKLLLMQAHFMSSLITDNPHDV